MGVTPSNPERNEQKMTTTTTMTDRERDEVVMEVLDAVMHDDYSRASGAANALSGDDLRIALFAFAGMIHGLLGATAVHEGRDARQMRVEYAQTMKERVQA